MLDVFAIVFAALIFVSAISVFIYSWRAYYKIPTLLKYKEMHPEARSKDGVPNCHSCHRSNIYLQTHNGAQIHLCRICGAKLWRS